MTCCRVMTSWGVLVEDATKKGLEDGIANLVTNITITQFMASDCDQFSEWPNHDAINLHEGVPQFRKHIKIHGLHKYSIKGCPKMVVVPQCNSSKRVGKHWGTTNMYQYPCQMSN